MQQPIPKKAVNDKKIADVVEKASQGDVEALQKFNNWNASVRLAMLNEQYKRNASALQSALNTVQTSVVAPQQEQTATPNQVVAEQVKTSVNEDVAPKATSKEELQAKISDKSESYLTVPLCGEIWSLLVIRTEAHHRRRSPQTGAAVHLHRDCTAEPVQEVSEPDCSVLQVCHSASGHCHPISVCRY